MRLNEILKVVFFKMMLYKTFKSYLHGNNLVRILVNIKIIMYHHYLFIVHFRPTYQGCYDIWDIRPKLILNSNLAKFISSIAPVLIIQSSSNVAHSTAVSLLCSVQNLKNDWRTETDVMDERVFTRFEFKKSFGRIAYIAQHPRPVVDSLAPPGSTKIMWAPGHTDRPW